MAFGYEKEVERERDALRAERQELLLAGDRLEQQLVDAALDRDKLRAVVETLTLRCAKLENVLRLIATPKRADGTYNYCREACEQLAKDVL